MIADLARRGAHQVKRLIREPEYRHIFVMLRRRPPLGFQPLNDTRPNRYPWFFGFVQDQLGAESNARILSFGCSTGEEVFTLRDYFPRATIRGIDINPGNIGACRRKLKASPDPKISFACARSPRAESTGTYDAIFCLAVLRDGRLTYLGLTSCESLIRFEDFARLTAEFSRCLRPGGLLIIRHSNFRLCDAPAGAAFEVLLSRPIPPNSATPIFGPDNRLMPGVEYTDAVFRKTRAEP